MQIPIISMFLGYGVLLPVEDNVFLSDFTGAFLISLSGALSPFDAFTAVLGCLGTIGPGFGAVGPANNYGFLSDFAKAVLSALMIIGRLELFNVFITPNINIITTIVIHIACLFLL